MKLHFKGMERYIERRPKEVELVESTGHPEVSSHFQLRQWCCFHVTSPALSHVLLFCGSEYPETWIAILHLFLLSNGTFISMLGPNSVPLFF